MKVSLFSFSGQDSNRSLIYDMEKLKIVFFSTREEFEKICSGVEYSEDIEDTWVDEDTLVFNRKGNPWHLIEDVIGKTLVDAQLMSVNEIQDLVHENVETARVALIYEGIELRK